MILIKALAIWGLLDLAFLAGTWWASRERRARPRDLPTHLRPVARPCLVCHAPDGEPIAIAADYIAPRADFDPSARAVLDTLVLVDALMRGKW